jgi:hypothetical protein
MFHLFSNQTHSSHWAATHDLSGQRLPSPNQWTYHKTVSENRIGFDSAKAAAAIARQGYYLFTTGILVKETEVTV